MVFSQRSRFVLIVFFFLLALLIASLNVSSVSAQGIIIDPPWPRPLPTPAPLPLPMPPTINIEQHSIVAEIDGPIAQVQVTQQFRNEQAVTVEGIYVFPLPKDAVVSDFQLTVDGQTLEGKLLGGDEARRIYEEIVRSQRDPALLEYLGRELFQTSVFPIPAGATRTVTFRYTQIVAQQSGLFKFSYPLRTAPFGSAPVKDLSLTVELRNQPGLRTIYSPQFALNIERADDSSASIRYRANAAQPDQDFELYFGVDEAAVGLNVLSYKPAGEDGFFLLLAAPSVDVAQTEIVERDLILVVDVSGSMQGEKIEQARNAAKAVVEQLHDGDRFNLIAFSTGVRLWNRRLQPASDANRQAAHRWIDGLAATGSTDINRSLLEGLSQLVGERDEPRPAYMLFLTDGLPTMGETEPQRIITNALNNAPARTVRLFTFGVGFDVNTDLLDRLSRELGGRSTYVKPDEAIDEKVGEFYAGISTPVLTDLALDWQSKSVLDELYPYPLPDLFVGDQLILVGRYQQGGPLGLTLSGTANERELIFEYTGHSLVTSGGEPFVARLWATRKIGALLEQIRQSGPLPELVDEVVELSLAYGIVTPYTSYLVVEPELQGDQATAAVPLLERAQADALYSLSQSAAAPASGADAVAASEMRSSLVNAANVRQNAQVRYIAGKTFVQKSLVEGADGQTVVRWVDTAYNEDLETETVIFGSERYFALARQPELAPWLALSSELLVVVDEGKALRITQPELGDRR